MIFELPGPEHVAGQHHGVLERRPNRGKRSLSPLATSVARPAAAVRSTLCISRRREGRIRSSWPSFCVGIGQQPAGDLDGLRDGLLALELVDGRAPHRTVDRHRRADGRNEDDVARHQLPVPAGIAVQQQIVEIERRDKASVALELDIAQRADLLHAAADEQRIRHGGQAAHRVGARLLGLAQHEHADGAQVAHGDADAGADELLGDALLDGCARALSKVMPLTLIGPSFGKLTRPSRSTVSS